MGNWLNLFGSISPNKSSPRISRSPGDDTSGSCSRRPSAPWCFCSYRPERPSTSGLYARLHGPVGPCASLTGLLPPVADASRAGGTLEISMFIAWSGISRYAFCMVFHVRWIFLTTSLQNPTESLACPSVGF